MKNVNGYLLCMKDVFGNVISDTYATYEVAFCVMVSRGSKLQDPSVLTHISITDNDTGEILFYVDPTTNNVDDYGFMVIWQGEGAGM